MQKQLILCVWLMSLLTFNVTAAELVTIPGIKESAISLNGTWKINLNPENEWQNERTPEAWENIQVPGECAMQGFKVQYNKPFVYKKKITIPTDYQGHSVFIQFDGVYSYAKVWFNGNFIKEHHGGFTTWYCDITPYAEAGKDAWLTVEVTDRYDDISYGSRYAFHPIGGILRDVYLLARPVIRLEQLHVETDLDAAYTNANLLLDYKISQGIPKNTQLQFRITDLKGKELPIPKSNYVLKDTAGSISILVNSPKLWDAEHPNLYVLTATLLLNGKITEQVSQRIGFREVEIKGNKLLVNGRNVKLRGTCRHDVSPTLGRCTSKELDETDVKLIKEANLNLVRTSHYPPSKAFLNFCDQYGLYVEEETAVCFTQNKSENDTAYTSRYLSQFAEMIARDRNHTSVIMWSMGNESKWGINFQKEYEYAKLVNPTRIVIFPNFGGIPDSVKCFDIDYVHYPTCLGNNIYHAQIRYFSNPDIPVLNDEWAHVPCYMTETLQEEFGARDFWGESMKRFWENIQESDGAGGAIWCMVDEYFMLPDSCKGTGEWGWVDVWRRKKPEFWHTKKAHSPIKISQSNITAFKSGMPLLVPVANNYDHTNLNEIKINWNVRNKSGVITDANIPPRSNGSIVIPADKWQAGDVISLSFKTANNELVDSFNIALGQRSVSFNVPPASPIEKQETSNNIVFSTGKFHFSIDKGTGLFNAISFENDTLVKNGPYLNMSAMQPCHEVFYGKCPLIKWNGKNWKMSELKTEITPNYIKIISRGAVDSIKVNFEYFIRSGGYFSIGYEIENPPKWQIQEAGIWLELPDKFSSIEWDRNALWNAYPQDHIGRAAGSSLLYNPGKAEAYREAPTHEWNMDSKALYFYFGPKGTQKEFQDLINEAKSLKTGLNYYSVQLKDGKKKLRAESNGTLASRLEKNTPDKLNLILNHEWDYVNLNWGNFERNIHITNNYKNLINLRLTDNNDDLVIKF